MSETTSAAEIITTHNTLHREVGVAEIILRLLDPRPLTDEEIEEHIEWGMWGMEEPRSIVNFHHPLLIGWHHEEFPVGTPDDFKEAFDTRQKIKKKHQHVHAGPIHERIYMFERPYRPMVAYFLLRRGLHRDNEQALVEFLIDLWTDTESARMNVWTDLLGAFPPGPHGAVEILDPSGTTTVYRGIAVGEDGEIDEHNPSWTTNKERATWFAVRFRNLEGREQPVLLTGEVDNDLVLFCATNRGEDEVVSNRVEVMNVEFL